MKLLDALKWRYAAKRMNGEKLPQAKLDTIMEAIHLAPSSLGLQPYSVIVVSDENLKKEIYEKACQQPQVLEGSHLVVFAAWNEVGPDKVDEYIQNMAQTRGVQVSNLSDFKSMVNGFVNRDGEDAISRWTARQAYIALGVGLVAAASEGVDATPMEGFDNAGMDEVLGLKEKGLSSVVMMALGYRDEENDYLAKAPKVRRQMADLFLLQ